MGSSGRDLPLAPRKLEREPRSLREEAFREGGEVGTRKDLRLRDSSGLGNGRYIVVAAITIGNRRSGGEKEPTSVSSSHLFFFSHLHALLYSYDQKTPLLSPLLFFLPFFR